MQSAKMLSEFWGLALNANDLVIEYIEKKRNMKVMLYFSRIPVTEGTW